MPSQRHAVALAFAESYAKCNLEQIFSIRSPDCKHSFIFSTGEAVVHTNSSYAEIYRPILPHLKHNRMTIKRVIEDKEANEVAIWVNVVIDFTKESMKPSKGDYVLFLQLYTAQNKVAHVREYIDRMGANSYMKKVQQAQDLAAKYVKTAQL